MKENTVFRLFEVVLVVALLITMGGWVASVVKKQIGLAVILFLIAVGIALLVGNLYAIQARIQSLERMNDLLRKDNAEKMAIIEGFKDFGK